MNKVPATIKAEDQTITFPPTIHRKDIVPISGSLISGSSLQGYIPDMDRDQFESLVYSLNGVIEDAGEYEKGYYVEAHFVYFHPAGAYIPFSIYDRWNRFRVGGFNSGVRYIIEKLGFKVE